MKSFGQNLNKKSDVSEAAYDSLSESYVWGSLCCNKCIFVKLRCDSNTSSNEFLSLCHPKLCCQTVHKQRTMSVNTLSCGQDGKCADLRAAAFQKSAFSGPHLYLLGVTLIKQLWTQLQCFSREHVGCHNRKSHARHSLHFALTSSLLFFSCSNKKLLFISDVG